MRTLLCSLCVLFCISCLSPALGQDEDQFKPFLGTWSGDLIVRDGDNRTCTVTVYMENGNAFVNRSLGRYIFRQEVRPPEEHKKLPAKIKIVQGKTCLIFWTGAYQYHWYISDGKLIGEQDGGSNIHKLRRVQ